MNYVYILLGMVAAYFLGPYISPTLGFVFKCAFYIVAVPVFTLWAVMKAIYNGVRGIKEPEPPSPELNGIESVDPAALKNKLNDDEAQEGADKYTRE